MPKNALVRYRPGTSGVSRAKFDKLARRADLAVGRLRRVREAADRKTKYVVNGLAVTGGAALAGVGQGWVGADGKAGFELLSLPGSLVIGGAAAVAGLADLLGDYSEVVGYAGFGAIGAEFANVGRAWAKEKSQK